MTDQESRQEMRELLHDAIDFVRSRGRHGGNCQVGPTLMMWIEFERWPWKGEVVVPRHPPSYEPLCSWIKIWFKGDLVLHIKFDDERMRTVKHHSGAWEHQLY